MTLHHVQVSCPPGSEDDLRAFCVGVLGMTEVPTPPTLAARGGGWFRAGSAEIHCGVESPFGSALKAHPGVALEDVEALARTVGASGSPIRWNDDIPGLRRFRTDDPVGNRLEFQQAQPSDGL